MKYESKRPSSADKDIPVYLFSVGKQELEILVKLTQQALDNTPKVIEIMNYRGRLRNIAVNFGKVWVQEIKGKTLPTKRVSNMPKSIKRLSK